jgi:hypothetical protein
MKICKPKWLALPALLFAASQSHAILYTASLSGPAEAPPNASAGSGSAQIDFDPLAHTLGVNVTFSGLGSGTTASHIHCCVAPPGAAGVATQVPTFINFPLGVTAGSYSNSFNTLAPATWNPAFISANGGTAAGAESALASGLAAGSAYLNIHTTQFPTGEIRGFLTPAAAQVSEPATSALLALAGLGLGLGRLRRRSR